MFNLISKWCNKHQGLLSLIAVIVAIYLNWADSVNSWISSLFNVSLKGVTEFLNQNVTIGTLFLLLLLYLIIKFIWKYLKASEIVVIKATYYTPTIIKDITKEIKKIVEEKKQFSFQIDNVAAGGDPQYGVPKKFDIDYKVGKTNISKTYSENEWIDLV